MTQETRTSASGARQGGKPALGDVLRAVRLAGGVSQEGWAARLGVGRRTVVRWEQGETVPDAAMAEVIVAACQEKALFRRAAVTPDLLRDLLAEARLARPDSGSGSTEPSPGAVELSTQGNLPAPLTSFIGRDGELEDVARLLGSTRLLTLAGAGGCGKTRLALEIARRCGDHYADGAWLVELASVSDPEAVVPAVAAALGVREEPGRPLQDALTGLLRARCLLLVLDNAEHVRDASAALADALLRACPRLTVLVTSRIALGVLGETVWRVPSLAVPDPAQSPVLETLDRFPSVQLFTARARSVRPGFTLTEANAAAVAQICQRLDGIPLAIELAAARVSALSAGQIAARLDDRFALLTEGNRTALPRHRTLRALIGWSYDLLTPDEQRLFARLAVFAGGFTLEAADAVCRSREQGTGNREQKGPAASVPCSLFPVPSSGVLDVLGSLVAHSLVQADEVGGAMRYRMLETLREYAATRLSEHDEHEALRGRHRDYYLTLAERAEAALSGPEQAAWLNRLTAEHDNCRAALTWCADGPGGAAAGLRLAGALWRFWELRGHLSEGRQRLDRALATRGSAPPAVWAKALGAAGNLARTQNDLAAAGHLYGRSLALARAASEPSGVAAALTRLGILRITEEQYTEAQALLEEGLAIRTTLKDQRGIGNSLHNLAYLSFCQGEVERARKRYEECLDVRREIGDRASIALTLNNLGFLALAQDNVASARSMFEEGLTHWRAVQDQRGMVFTLRGLGETACREGRHAAAGTLFAESLSIAQRLGMRKNIAEGLEGLASVARGLGQPARAARILGASDALRETVRGVLDPDERVILERIVAAVRRELTDAAFARAWADGKAMTVDEAIAFALQSVDSQQTAG